MPSSPLISYAQNGEDVVLWRALGHIRDGRYIEVGANDPSIDSVTRLFYDSGWSGITVEPVLAYVEAQRAARPRDTIFAVAAGDGSVDTATLHVIEDTGLSTTVGDGTGGRAGEHDVTVPMRSLDSLIEESGLDEGDIHFLVVDVEGAEADVIAGLDLSRFRPWVLVIEATAPNSTVPTHQGWEPVLLAAGYEFVLFDGLNRFYLATERRQLRDILSYPACVHDDFVRAEPVTSMRAELDRLHALLADQERELEQLRADVRLLRAEKAAFHQTLSWRMTRPLRAIRRLGAGRSE